jgi:hypothetical protein
VRDVFFARPGCITRLNLQVQLEGSHETVRDDETSRLPPGYRLDLVGDPCVIILRGPDDTVVARFTRNVDPQEIRQAAEQDCRVRGR